MNERAKSYGAHVNGSKPIPGLPTLSQAPLLITTQETGRVFTCRLNSARFSSKSALIFDL
jgi:hypothetical protein